MVSPVTNIACLFILRYFPSTSLELFVTYKKVVRKRFKTLELELEQSSEICESLTTDKKVELFFLLYFRGMMRRSMIY